MALTDLQATYPDASQFSGTVSQLILDAENEEGAFILQLPRGGTIDAVAWETGNVVDGTGGIDVSLQTVGTDGFATGVAYGGMVLGTEATVAANTQYVTSLGTSATATAGDWVAVVFAHNSWGVGQDVDVRTHSGYSAGNVTRHPYASLYTGSWAKVANVAPMCALEYATTTYYPINGVGPADVDAMAFNSTDTPDELGNRFQLPVSVRCVGIWAMLDIDAGDDFELVLYSGDGGGEAVEATLSVDGDYSGSAVVGSRMHYFAAPVTLAADTQYRIAVKPGGTDVTFYYQVAASVAMMGAYPLGANCYSTSRTDGAGWTDATTTIYGIGIIADQIDTGGAGGLLLHGGMTGGIDG